MNSERLFLFASGLLLFILGFFLPPPINDSSQYLFVNVVFSASVSFGGICFMVAAFQRC